MRRNFQCSSSRVDLCCIDTTVEELMEYVVRLSDGSNTDMLFQNKRYQWVKCGTSNIPHRDF